MISIYTSSVKRKFILLDKTDVDKPLMILARRNELMYLSEQESDIQ
jgi:hypothetical protein